MNDNQKTTRDHGNERETASKNEERQLNSKEQLAPGSNVEKSSVQTAAMHKKHKRNNRPRPLL